VKVITGFPVESWTMPLAGGPAVKLPQGAPCQESAGLLAWDGPDEIPMPVASPRVLEARAAAIAAREAAKAKKNEKADDAKKQEAKQDTKQNAKKPDAKDVAKDKDTKASDPKAPAATTPGAKAPDTKEPAAKEHDAKKSAKTDHAAKDGGTTGADVARK
jgi:hypothetical protein